MRFSRNNLTGCAIAVFAAGSAFAQCSDAALGQKIMSRATEAQAEAKRATADAGFATLLDPAFLAKKDFGEIDRRLAAMDRLLSAIDQLTPEKSRPFMIDLIKACKKSPSEQQAFLAGFERGFDATNGDEALVLFGRLAGEMRAVFGILRERPERWAVEDGQVAFMDDATVERFNAALGKVNVTIQAMTKLKG